MRMAIANSIVSIVRCSSYGPAKVQEAVSLVMEKAGVLAKLPSSGTVLLKPNLLSTRKPEDAVTTHPEVVRAVGEVVMQGGAELVLGDSPPFAGERQAKYAKLCDVTGMTAVAEELGARLARFEEQPVEISCPAGRIYRRFEVGREVVEANSVISISKLKTHGLTQLSGAVKNLFGCVPGIRKGLFHVQSAENPTVFAQMLLDLMRAFPPVLHIMDAVVAMEGAGPNAGTPRQVGLLLASIDPVALDAVASAIIGVDPMNIQTTRLAHEQGLGCGEISRIEIRGETLANAIVEGFQLSTAGSQWAKIPSPIRSLLRRQLVASPRVLSAECKGCGDCSEVCPAKAITPGRPPEIDLAACIRCYCCHEVCNFSAIELKKGLLGNLLSRKDRKR